MSLKESFCVRVTGVVSLIASFDQIKTEISSDALILSLKEVETRLTFFNEEKKSLGITSQHGFVMRS